MLKMSWFNVTLANGQTHKVYATDKGAAAKLVLFDRELVPFTERGQYPKVTPFEEPLKVQSVKGNFSIGDSMVSVNGRTFVKRAVR